MMMMTLHQMRHGRQDNHANSHARCVNRSKAKHTKVRKLSEAKQSEPQTLETHQEEGNKVPDPLWNSGPNPSGPPPVPAQKPLR
jgi:hypothetical protein